MRDLSSVAGPQMDLFDGNTGPFLSEHKTTRHHEKNCLRCYESFLSDHEVAARYGISRAAIWRWVRRNQDFPKPIKLSPGTTRWRLNDLVRFEVSRTQGQAGLRETVPAGDSK